MDLNLKGKRALVCGSTQGIGKAAAIELALLGANITLFGRNKEKLEMVSKELQSLNKELSIDYLIADFNRTDEVKQTIENYPNLKEISILVNNTGGPPAGNITDATIDNFEAAFKMHLMCNHILAQACIPSMKALKFGRIINVISTSVKIPLPGLGVSNTIRGAVANWAKTMANELGQFNITVNNILPGATHTSRLDEIAKNKSQKTGKKVDEIFEAMSAQVPMKRVAQAKEVAAAIAFLASPAAAYINGINLPVDGGRTGSL